MASAAHPADSGGGGAAAVVILGASLAVIGYAGTFFGNLIKAAVSRQREYLADAAAVQYTRNPPGISGALQKIGSAGSLMRNSGANEISHMFFGQAINHFLGNMMATHPPLPRRISAIDPGWNGEFPTSLIPQSSALAAEGVSNLADEQVKGVVVDVESLPEVVGRPDIKSYETADAIIDTSDRECLSAARTHGAAHLLIYALLLHPRSPEAEATRAQQLQILATLKSGERNYVERLQAEILSEDDLHRLSLLELAVPALKQMSYRQYQQFVKTVIALIKADKTIELFEWVMHRLLLKELAPHFERPRPPRVRYRSIESVAPHAAVLLATLAEFGHDDDEAKAEAYAAASEELQSASVPPAPRIDRTDNFAALNEALRELRDLAPLQKPKLLKACARARCCTTMKSTSTKARCCRASLRRSIARCPPRWSPGPRHMADTAKTGPRQQFAALDLGSNSFHLVVANYSKGRLATVDKIKEMVRLAEGVDTKGEILDDAMARAIECLTRFGQRLRGIPAENVRVVGTNTLRKAKNSSALPQTGARKALNHEIEIISGHRRSPPDLHRRIACA